MRVTNSLLFTSCLIFAPAPANLSQEVGNDVDTLEIPETDAPARNYGMDCVRTLLQVGRTPLLLENCCLTKLCVGTGGGGSGALQKVCTKEDLAAEKKKGCGTKPISFTLESSASLSYAQASNSRTRDKKMRFENITKISARISGLQFLDVPKGDEMRIHNLRLEEEYLLFEVFSSLMGYLQPDQFPADLVRDVLHKRVPFHLFAFQLLKTEIATLSWMIFWTVAALSIPFITLAYCCCSKGKFHRLQEDGSDIALDFRDKCVERTLTVLLLFFLVLELFPIILIFLGNEQISRQMSRSVATTNLIFEDLETFTKNTHRQMSFVATSSTDITIEAIRKDLEDVEELLGRPFQEELARETGIDSALAGLDEVKATSDEVSSLVAQLSDECESANKEANLLQEQLREVSREVAIARQQCRLKDRALCYTLHYTGLEVLFSCGNLTTDFKIKQLRNIVKQKIFETDVDRAKTTFRQLPQRVSQDAASRVTEIKSVLSRKRTEVYKSTHSLDELSRSLSNSIRTSQHATLEVVETLNRWELWRWLSVLGISTLVSLVWGLLLCGAPCGCGTTSRTIPLLLSGVIVTSLICLPVWTMGLAKFLLGIHGQSLLCQPLYQNYKALEEILRWGGILYKEGGVLKANDSLKIRQVLESCQLNQPSYSTFRLQDLFDASSVTNYKTWSDFKTASNFTPDSFVEFLSPSLQLNLQFLATISSLDLTSYRTKMSGPLTKKDLNSFADQLNTVARQLSDASSSKRIDELALKVRRIIGNETARLAELKDRILYKITALDFLAHPLGQGANRSLTHFRDVQDFVDRHGREVAQRVAAQFTSRLEAHLEALRKHVTSKLTKDIGRCRPLWDIFRSLRFSVCKLIVDPTNGVSASSFALTLLFLGTVIVVLNLVEHYREVNEELLTSVTHRRARDGLIIDDEGTWASPSLETPPDAEMRNNGQSEQALWVTPNSRQSSEPLIPPVPKVLPTQSTSRAWSPKRLSTIASRISAARVPQIPSVSRARSPKRGRHESLRLIEPICWKSGSLSPKSWL